MKKTKLFFCFLTSAALLFVILGSQRLAFAAGRTVNVATASALTSALQNAQPGDVIQLADGTYSGHFTATVSGTAAAPITLTGSVNAVLDGGGNGSGYAFHLSGASYWHLVGFHVTDAQKGIVVDSGTYNVIDGIQVDNIGDEGIHLRSFSSHNTVQNCDVIQTGVVSPGYGEGIYLGSAQSNWATYSNGQPDTSDYNQVLNNHIGPSVTAEEIDIKEGTTGGLISGNTFDGTGMSGANSADSWVDVKGNNYTLSNNTGAKSINDGFQTHVILSGWGNNNVFQNNNANVEGPGYGFRIQTTGTGNIVYDNNIVTNAASGIANIALTPSGSATATSIASTTPSPVPTQTLSSTLAPSVTASAAPPTKTSTPAATVGPTNTPVPSGNGLTVQIDKGGGTDNTQETTFNFLVKNTGSSSLSGLAIRIYFTLDGSNAASGYTMEKYYDQSGVATIVAPTACGSSTSVYYFTISYGTATLAAGSQWEFQTALHLSSWASTYDGSNDWYHTGYALGALPASYTTTNDLPGYVNGTLSWGSTPSCGGSVTTTPTFVPPSSTAVPPTKTNTPVPTAGPSNTPVPVSATPIPPTKTTSPMPTTGPSNTPVPASTTPTRTNTPNSPTSTLAATPVSATATPVSATVTPTPNASDPCASPKVITGGGTFSVSTTATCFKYVNTVYVNGAMFSVIKDSTSTSDTLKWYGGMDQNATSCTNQIATIGGNGGQLNNFTIAKDSSGQMFLIVTGSAANSVTMSIQNWQNGVGCSVKPTVHP